MTRANFQWCEKCGEDTDHEFQAAEPDVGIMSNGWICLACGHSTIAEDDDEPDWVDIR